MKGYDVPLDTKYVFLDRELAEELLGNEAVGTIDSVVESEEGKNETRQLEVMDFGQVYDAVLAQYGVPDDYLREFLQRREDFTEKVPLKFLHVHPRSIMGGVLGYTYLGENFMARRDDLYGETARMVDIHESIHTPDEYETRVITSWMMEQVRDTYIR